MMLIKAPHNDEMIYIEPLAFTQLCIAIHKFNKQWWLDPATGEPRERNIGEMIALMHSELSEALEAHRKNLPDAHLPQYAGIDVELVDCIIRCMDLLGARFAERVTQWANDTKVEPRPASPGEIFGAKCEFNALREDHRPEARLAPGGKQF